MDVSDVDITETEGGGGGEDTIRDMNNVIPEVSGFYRFFFLFSTVELFFFLFFYPLSVPFHLHSYINEGNQTHKKILTFFNI